MRTVLLISRCFPPAYDVGGKRAYRFAKYLPHFGWLPLIWTAPIPHGLPVDPTPLEINHTGIERSLEPTWWPKSYFKHTVAGDLLGRAESFALALSRVASIPLGRDVFLLPRAALILQRVCRKWRIDAILATAGPAVALVYGWMAHKFTGAPLLLDLRDPWSLNLLQLDKAVWVRRVERFVERFLFERAERIILTSDDATSAYRQFLPDFIGQRIITITNSFDPDYRTGRRIPAGPIRIIHFGHCNGLRSLGTVLRALALLRHRNLWPASGIQLINLGRVRADDMQLAASLGLADVVQKHPLVAYREGLEMMAGADVLLLLGYGEETLHIPAKTFDYLLVGVPVLCLSPRCHLTEIITTTGVGNVVEPGDVHGAASVIQILINARRSESSPAARTAHGLERYSALTTTAQLAAALNEAVAPTACG